MKRVTLHRREPSEYEVAIYRHVGRTGGNTGPVNGRMMAAMMSPRAVQRAQRFGQTTRGSSNMYLGFGPDIIHLARAPHGPGEVGRLEGFNQPDPRIAQVVRRRAKNRAARKSRGINRRALR